MIRTYGCCWGDDAPEILVPIETAKLVAVECMNRW
jgi:hypothetical protein